MSESQSARSKLNACSLIFFKKYEEAPDLMDLSLHVLEARKETDPVPVKIGSDGFEKILEGSYPVTARAGLGAFTITFEDYIAFSVRNESFAQTRIKEDSSLKLRTYIESDFLDYVSKSTFANFDYPGPFKHYSLVCADHVIDVVCQSEPSIEHRIIRRDEM